VKIQSRKNPQPSPASLAHRPDGSWMDRTPHLRLPFPVASTSGCWLPPASWPHLPRTGTTEARAVSTFPLAHPCGPASWPLNATAQHNHHLTSQLPQQRESRIRSIRDGTEPWRMACAIVPISLLIPSVVDTILTVSFFASMAGAAWILTCLRDDA
jgi:hypothetical protein